MRFSLILATLGRTIEVGEFLDSLMCQKDFDGELILVDQNPDERLLPYVTKHSNWLNIVWLKSAPGLSRARNVGLAVAKGDIVGFPDDDCVYPPELLKVVDEGFSANPAIDALTGRTTDNLGREERKWPSRRIDVTKLSVWRTSISFTIFALRQSLPTDTCFDVSIGVGAGTPWGSGEETDFLLSMIKRRSRIVYLPEILVFHPLKIGVDASTDLSRAKNYSRGVGYVMSKNGYPIWYFTASVCASLARASKFLILLDVTSARLNYVIARSKVQGWLDFLHVPTSTRR